MFEPVKIAPSILSADFMNLGRDVRMIEEGGAEMVHIDVMDGHFVSNLTMGFPVIRQLRAACNLELDVHLMISNPIEQLTWFCTTGCDSITVHCEPLYGNQLATAVHIIKDAGIKAALALKPQTPTAVLEPVIAELDMVLIMSVEPGFSGQSFIAGSETKIAEVVALARAAGNDTLAIQVDGGINAQTAPLAASAGADVLVCGNAVFSAPDPRAAIGQIRREAEAARLRALA